MELDALQLEDRIGGGSAGPRESLLPAGGSSFADFYVASGLRPWLLRLGVLRPAAQLRGRAVRALMGGFVFVAALLFLGILVAGPDSANSTSISWGGQLLTLFVIGELTLMNFFLHRRLTVLATGRSLSTVTSEMSDAQRQALAVTCRRYVRRAVWAWSFVTCLWLVLCALSAAVAGSAPYGSAAFLLGWGLYMLVGLLASMASNGALLMALLWLWVSCESLRSCFEAYRARLVAREFETPHAALREYVRLAGHVSNQARLQEAQVGLMLLFSVVVSGMTAVIIVLASNSAEAYVSYGLPLYMVCCAIPILVVYAIARVNDYFDELLRALTVHDVFEADARAFLRDDLRCARARFETYGFAPDNSVIAAGCVGVATTVMSAVFQS